ncbi:hypothetical protein F6R98_04025 [Candidatus Methylospira mobilis]|uniref:Uncharacterized protein n=1 Tax=Candidatus Methylospira mobilis TaxID=1808979 RepID=A0A5Q0BDD8_9GAMM|nr:hypothetical protein [Candidatus Methylospira mobilis]QFY41903.1 hypothetical protein F6R98_04025 [Candidatus Methylospira mobilis]WNV06781.1 hypothetical protein RP726_10360 [Candidatus Methylospira mobilis]
MARKGIRPGLQLLQLSALLLACQTAPANSAPFEFLYIEANEGTASGGHVAARLGDEVFHYQHVEPGLLRLFRDDWLWFNLHYGTHENRNIHAQTIELNPETHQRLYDELEHRRLLQDEQFATLQGLHQQLSLLRLFHAQQQGEQVVLDVAGAGLFNDKPGVRQEPALLSLRDEITELAGNRLAQKIATLTRELEQPVFTLSAPATNGLSTLEFQPNPYTAAQHYADLLLLRRALQTLAAAYPLQSGRILEPAPAELILSLRQKQTLENYRQKLHRELRLLALNPQPEKALALISGLAQLAALSRSLDSGQLLFLDTKETAGPAQGGAPKVEHGVTLQTLFAQARGLWLQQKSRLDSSEELNELNYRALEKAANVFMYFRGALQSPATARMIRLQTVPQTGAAIALPSCNLGAEKVKESIVELEERERRLTEQMHTLYRYHLIERNCVTELLSKLNEVQPVTVSRSTLQAFSFIPFISYELMQSNAGANRNHLIPSHRNRLLARSKALEDPVWVALRESNTITATLYSNQTQPPAFLFFTEDALWPRPLQGSMNAATGLVQVTAGLFSLPWDNGERLKLGAGALLVSLPELFFFNIRKGSYPEWTQPVPWN